MKIDDLVGDWEDEEEEGENEDEEDEDQINPLLFYFFLKQTNYEKNDYFFIVCFNLWMYYTK